MRVVRVDSNNPFFVTGHKRDMAVGEEQVGSCHAAMLRVLPEDHELVRVFLGAHKEGQQTLKGGAGHG